MLLADTKLPSLISYAGQTTSSEAISGATLRMARLYYDRYSWILDWSDSQGKTAQHIAALKGNEELVRVCAVSPFCQDSEALNSVFPDVL